MSENNFGMVEKGRGRSCRIDREDAKRARRRRRPRDLGLSRLVPLRASLPRDQSSHITSLDRTITGHIPLPDLATRLVHLYLPVRCDAYRHGAILDAIGSQIFPPRSRCDTWGDLIRVSA